MSAADALLTQRELALTWSGTQGALLFHGERKPTRSSGSLRVLFPDRGQPHFVEHTPPDHGRIETRKIWTTTELNSYLDFPHVGQAFVIERHRTDKKSGESSREVSYGLTSRPRKQAGPQRVSRSTVGIG